MNETANEVTGWKWTMYAGLIPLMAGFFMLLTSNISMSNDMSLWTFVIHNLDFSFSQLAAVDPQAGPFVAFLAMLASVNIVSAAVPIILISIFALRKGQKWAWYYLLFMLVWEGFNDVYSVTLFYFETGAPMFIMPWLFCILMATGLYKTRQQVFNQ
ncbi:hypothetical protein [Pseudoalteromonas luteoviolacea]|uniref:hypothetical protein n=1 Tax=Pseudoalteromonas luteoviolacea TaxID=43657 RepID=UPI001B397726|nr:hypothetical protein [Pseudoalteromonas luteoviolacea]MBQ4836688.1 hypothetical protein [Pseudoalteromonas luteoviolacea]